MSEKQIEDADIIWLTETVEQRESPRQDMIEKAARFHISESFGERKFSYGFRDPKVAAGFRLKYSHQVSDVNAKDITSRLKARIREGHIDVSMGRVQSRLR